MAGKYNVKAQKSTCLAEIEERYLTPDKETEAFISGFRRHVDEICGLLGYYAA
jgi:hypothetical protein